MTLTVASVDARTEIADTGEPGVSAARLDGTTPTDWRHIPALDGLRAAAVIAVLVFHAGYLQGGFLGVDLFFALSGFLITSLLIRDAAAVDGTGIGLAAFWGRRFRRLLPAALMMIAVVALWSWIFGSGADLAGVKADGPFAVLYIANWNFIADADGYWQSFAQPSMFDHLWSLAIEEQFYLLWPLVLVAIWKWSRRPARTLAIVAGCGIVLSLIAMVWLYDGVEPTRVYMGTDTRAASLLVGALAATEPARGLARRAVDLLGARINVVVAGLVIAILWSWFAVDGASSGLLYRGGLLAHSAACAVLISLVVAVDRGPLVRGLGVRPIAWVGVMSYGLYLWHWPIFVALSPERTGIDGVPLAVVRVVVAALVAYLSFRLIEDPIRRRASWAVGRRGLVALCASIVGLLVVLVALPEPAVEIAAFDAASIAVAAPLVESPPQGQRASVETENVPVSTRLVEIRPTVDAVPEPSQRSTLPTAPPPEALPTPTPTPARAPAITSALWAGDSVAYDLAPAVIASLHSAGLAVDDLEAYPGFRLVSERRDIDLSIRVPERAAKIGADVALVQISNWDVDVAPDVYRAEVVELAADLDAIGARLVMVATPPTARSDVNADLDRLFLVVADLDRSGTVANLDVIDSRSWWGLPGAIDLDGDGTPERKRDLTHVCPSGAARFGATLANELAGRFDGVQPGDPAVWADAVWVFDERYDEPVGACAPVG